jgi:apolipoprotein D and lipocalin family protein
MKNQITHVLSLATLLLPVFSCASGGFYKTVDRVDMSRFMTQWYVIGGRLTMFEKGAHNATETYSWNAEKKQIDIDFNYRKNAFDGEIKSIPQTGWVYNETTKAHWKVRPFWPLKLDYLVIALDPNYEWTAIGVPNQKYLWIMSTKPELSERQYQDILQYLDSIGYSTRDLIHVPQKW